MPDSSQILWRPESAWAGIARPGRGGAAHGEAGIRVELGGSVRLATIIAHAGGEAELARLLEKSFGCRLPPAGRVSFGRDCDLVWSAPGQWLAVRAATGADTDLPGAVAGVAAVTDQSGSRALLHLSGSKARDALAKGFAIDLHPSVFTKGCTAITRVAHISVQIWQSDEAPRYTIAVPRSLAASFWSWLTSASAAYGYEVTDCFLA